MHCYLLLPWLTNKRSIILSKSNVVLDANALVHHICHLHQGDGLIPCLFGDQMQSDHMSLIAERKQSPVWTREAPRIADHACAYTSACHGRANDYVWRERPTGCHATFWHQSSFLPQTLPVKDEECQRPVPRQHRRRMSIRQKRRARCSPVSPAAQREIRRQQILHWQLALGETLSSHLNSIRPRRRQAFGCFISSPSPRSLKVCLIHLAEPRAWTQITFGIWSPFCFC